jgi:hypothetical protein
MKHTTRFILQEESNNPLDGYLFYQMAYKIALEACVSPWLVQKISKKAISQWEETTGKSIKELGKLHPEDRAEEIYKILEYVERSLAKMVRSQKHIEKSISIATVSMELMLNP